MRRRPGDARPPGRCSSARRTCASDGRARSAEGALGSRRRASTPADPAESAPLRARSRAARQEGRSSRVWQLRVYRHGADGAPAAPRPARLATRWNLLLAQIMLPTRSPQMPTVPGSDERTGTLRQPAPSATSARCAPATCATRKPDHGGCGSGCKTLLKVAQRPRSGGRRGRPRRGRQRRPMPPRARRRRRTGRRPRLRRHLRRPRLSLGIGGRPGARASAGACAAAAARGGGAERARPARGARRRRLPVVGRPRARERDLGARRCGRCSGGRSTRQCAARMLVLLPTGAQVALLPAAGARVAGPHPRRGAAPLAHRRPGRRAGAVRRPALCTSRRRSRPPRPPTFSMRCGRRASPRPFCTRRPSGSSNLRLGAALDLLHARGKLARIVVDEVRCHVTPHVLT